MDALQLEIGNDIEALFAAFAARHVDITAPGTCVGCIAGVAALALIEAAAIQGAVAGFDAERTMQVIALFTMELERTRDALAAMAPPPVGGIH